MALPHKLMVCPHCYDGSLAWDGRSAWRCDSLKTWNKGTMRCHYGLTLDTIVEDQPEAVGEQRLTKQAHFTEFALRSIKEGEIRTFLTPEQAAFLLQNDLPEALRQKLQKSVFERLQGEED